MSLYEIPVRTLAGAEATLADQAGKVLLFVNVASQCGHTPQYAGLEKLQERYATRGFSVIGVPSNQFGGQEPGSPEEIAEFCSSTYGVSFPLLEKADVNGDDRHPLYAELTKVAYADGAPAGDVQWNFEKFLVSSAGEVVARWGFRTQPEDDSVVAAIESALAA